MAKQWGFTYIFCNDLDSMKWFYTEILRLKLIWDNNMSIAYKIGEHQLSIAFNEDFNPQSQKFAIQPGWKGGTEPRISWSIECAKKDFIEIVQSVDANDVPKFYNEPQWTGYWSFPILDPMNNTLEITCTEENI